MSEQYNVDIPITKLIKHKRVIGGGFDYLVVIGEHGHTICKECYLRFKIEYVKYKSKG